MTAPIAIQLYTVRDVIAKHYEGTVRKIAEMGYVGVEPAGFPGSTPKAAAQLFKKLGLKVPSIHASLPIGDKRQEVLDTAKLLNLEWIISGTRPDDVTTIDGIKAVCNKYDEGAKVAADHGFKVAIHNHWWEFGMVDSKRVYRVMLDLLTPDVFFQTDVYWIQTAGLNPADVIKELGPRAPLIHAKDGPCNQQDPMTAVGEGKVDFAAIVAAGKKTIKWTIVELDRCATDMMEAVRKSYVYLTGKGLAKGSR